MIARLLSVNLAVPRMLRTRGRDIPTGIFKEPAAGRVRMTRLGLAGDIQADRRYHGGPEQAVYAYSGEHAARWTDELGRTDPPPPGFFGENFTTQGLLEEDVAVGDVYGIGSARVQVTKPRSPCFKMGLRAGSARFVRTFLESGRIGFYMRVFEEGDVAAGDAIERIERPADPVAMSDLIALLYFRPADRRGLDRALRSEALGEGLRRRLEEIRQEPALF
jgi:MOSC domain-containing protein YiiM